eukprot:6190125-Pleurochrysis_carterae.AAC.3
MQRALQRHCNARGDTGRPQRQHNPADASRPSLAARRAKPRRPPTAARGQRPSSTQRQPCRARCSVPKGLETD